MTWNEDNWLLRVRNLTKIYGEPNDNTLALTGPAFNTNICPETDSIVACADISFDLYPGEVLGIVGESGSGKSTVVKMLYFDLEKTTDTSKLLWVLGFPVVFAVVMLLLAASDWLSDYRKGYVHSVAPDAPGSLTRKDE